MRRFAAIALAACCATPAFAQSAPPSTQLPSPEDIANRDSVTFGAGAAVVPDYEGSDDYRIVPGASVRGKVSGISFISRGTYLYVDVVPSRGKVDLDFGPIAGARLNTRRHIHDPVVKLLPKLKNAIELGAFGGVSFHGVTNPYDTLALRLDVLHDVANAHKSTTFSPNLDFSTPVSRSTFVGASLGAEFVSNRFADYYFSITPADSLATGSALPVFNAGGGMKDWKLRLLVDHSLTGDLLHGFSIVGVGQYSRLVGDFKRSPIVSQRGSSSQWIGALGLAYTW